MENLEEEFVEDLVCDFTEGDKFDYDYDFDYERDFYGDIEIYSSIPNKLNVYYNRESEESYPHYLLRLVDFQVKFYVNNYTDHSLTNQILFLSPKTKTFIKIPVNLKITDFISFKVSDDKFPKSPKINGLDSLLWVDNFNWNYEWSSVFINQTLNTDILNTLIVSYDLDKIKAKLKYLESLILFL